MRSAALVLALLCLPAALETAAGDPGAVRALQPDDVPWELLRTTPRLERAMMHGDQAKPGPFTFRVRASAGHRLLPHTHPDERTITVLQGTYWSAVGAVWDEGLLVAYPAGTFYVVPAGVPHYSAVLEGETVFQESGTGPSRNDMLPQPQ